MSKQQSGNALIIILIVIVFAGLTGFIAWRALNSPTATPEQSLTLPQTDPNEGYLAIEEWGVRFKPVEGLTLHSTEYFKATKVESDSVFITTRQLSDVEPNCGEKTDMVAPLGLLSRSATEDPTLGSVIAKIGDHYYQYRGSDAACSKNATNYTLEANYRKLVTDSLASLELSK
jgi:hypothetical protein